MRPGLLGTCDRSDRTRLCACNIATSWVLGSFVSSSVHGLAPPQDVLVPTLEASTKTRANLLRGVAQTKGLLPEKMIRPSRGGKSRQTWMNSWTTGACEAGKAHCRGANASPCMETWKHTWVGPKYNHSINRKHPNTGMGELVSSTCRA